MTCHRIHIYDKLCYLYKYIWCVLFLYILHIFSIFLLLYIFLIYILSIQLSPLSSFNNRMEWMEWCILKWMESLTKWAIWLLCSSWVCSHPNFLFSMEREAFAQSDSALWRPDSLSGGVSFCLLIKREPMDGDYI